jgi:hypothetical protein
MMIRDITLGPLCNFSVLHRMAAAQENAAHAENERQGLSRSSPPNARS